MMRKPAKEKKSVWNRNDEWLCRFEMQERALKVISWELEENIGQTLWLARLQLGHLKESLSKEERVKAIETGKILQRVIRDLKVVTRQNAAEEILLGGFVAGIEKELTLRRNLHQNRVQLKTTGVVPDIQPARELKIFCTIQEIINDNFNRPDETLGSIHIRCSDKTIAIRISVNHVNGIRLVVSEGAIEKMEQLSSTWFIKSTLKKDIVHMSFSV